MSDSIQLVVTKSDGTIVNVTGTLTASTVTETAQVVTPIPPPAVEPTIPASATTVDMLPNVIAWKMNHDAGTPGSSNGMTSYPVSADDGSIVRRFQFTLTAKGGEIYHANVMADSSTYNTFCLETVESSEDWSNIACAEKDMEHVNADGAYVDMATQLSIYEGSVDITQNGKWMSTNIQSDPSTLAPKVLHVQRRYVRDNGDGTVNYIGIFMDGVYFAFKDASAIHSRPTAHWGKNILNLQIQYDGKSTGSVQSIVDMHVMKVHAWKS
jgi:hypothetical protein